MANWRKTSATGTQHRTLLAILFLLCGVPADAAQAQTPADDAVESRLDRLERQSAALVEENGRLQAEIETLKQSSAAGTADTAGDLAWFAPPDRFTAGYDDGFVIVPTDPQDTPFSFKSNNQNMFRYTGFARDVATWSDSAGNVNDVTNRSNFEIPRGRLIFSGTALMPDLSYYINVDYNTVTTQPIGFRGYWLSYRFSRAVQLYIGQNKVPGTREWLSSSIDALGPDRSLATTFFRPSLSQGVWITGEPLDGLYYHAMLSNGFNTVNAQPSQLDNRFCWAGSTWWEPLGKFGATYSDLEWHDTAVIRCGASLTYSAAQGQQGNPNDPENAQIRLSDGTVITATGAFAPGVTLQSYEIGLAAFDFAWKLRGWSLSSEFYLQDLFGLRGDGPLPVNSTFAYGGFAQLGWFPVPQKLEVYGRTSQVSGAYGTGGEYATGVNWFFLPGRNNLRFTVDVAWINHSPADQNRTDYRAGDTGLLLRTQIQSNF
jgi:hypothetical protein